MSMLNKKACREFIKERVGFHGMEFEGISEKFWPALEASLKVVINNAIVNHPDKKKRITIVPEGFI